VVRPVSTVTVGALNEIAAGPGVVVARVSVESTAHHPGGVIAIEAGAVAAPGWSQSTGAVAAPGWSQSTGAVVAPGLSPGAVVAPGVNQGPVSGTVNGAGAGRASALVAIVGLGSTVWPQNLGRTAYLSATA
jgi:hypothetical protein